MHNPAEIVRLQTLADNAATRLNKAIADLNQIQIDVARERSTYFEKLTIGAGAVIAAMVSFLANHTAGLHPAWLLRCSLVALAVVIIAGLYRSFRYPYYIIQVRKAIWIAAALDDQHKRFDHILALPNAVDVHTGQLINKAEIERNLKKSAIEDEATNKQQNAIHERLLRECHIAEWICLVAVAVAMTALVWLALSNF